jgi:hypothetical protein
VCVGVRSGCVCLCVCGGGGQLRFRMARRGGAGVILSIASWLGLAWAGKGGRSYRGQDRTGLVCHTERGRWLWRCRAAIQEVAQGLWCVCVCVCEQIASPLSGCSTAEVAQSAGSSRMWVWCRAVVGVCCLDWLGGGSAVVMLPRDKATSVWLLCDLVALLHSSAGGV